MSTSSISASRIDAGGDPTESSSSSAATNLLTAPAPELTPEEEARLDADPLHRLYDSHKIEAPSTLSTVLGVFTKLLLLQEREDIAEFAVEYFEHMKLARAADPRIDFDRFISTQLKILEKKYAPSAYDPASEFAPPEALAPILIAFSSEVIRYQPGSDSSFFGWALEYFTALVEDGTAREFLIKQARLAEEKQRAADIEKKRAQTKREKTKKKVSMN